MLVNAVEPGQWARDESHQVDPNMGPNMGTCESTEEHNTACESTEEHNTEQVLEQDDINKVTYRILQQHDVAAAVEVLALAFFEGEPVTGQFGVTLKDMRAFCQMYIPRMAQQGHTVVAVEHDTDCILGAFLCEDYCSPVPAEFSNFLDEADGTWAPLLRMLDELDNHLHDTYSIPSCETEREAGKWFHLWMLGVSSKARGRQIAKKLSAHSVLLAREQGFSVAFAECTGAASTKILTKVCGAASAKFIDYATWGGAEAELDGLRELPSKGHLGMTLTVNDLAEPATIASINHLGGWKRRPWFRNAPVGAGS